MTADAAAANRDPRPGTSGRGYILDRGIRIFDIVCTPDGARHTGSPAAVHGQ